MAGGGPESVTAVIQGHVVLVAESEKAPPPLQSQGESEGLRSRAEKIC